MEVRGSVALVTGGAQGLGLAIASQLASEGAVVVVADRDTEALAVLPEGLEAVAMDVTDPGQVNSAVGRIVENHGSIHVLVNNAGVIHSEPFINLINPAGVMHDYGRFRATVTANLDSVFIVTAAVVEQMVKLRTKGVIVNISSISATGNEGQTAYSAAKAGVNALTVTWAKELGRWGVRCNAVAPGFINTLSLMSALREPQLRRICDDTPLRRLGEAYEVAKAVCAVVQNDFINGAVIPVTGGLRI